MANLTITIDDEVLRRARIKALEQNTSLNAKLREYLEAFAGMETSNAAMKDFVKLAQKSTSGSGNQGRRWQRDDLYER
jgi:plasmid stability protein